MPEPTSQQPLPEHLEELAAGYVLNALSPEETVELERYLQENPASLARIEQLQEVMGLMAHLSPRLTAPLHLKTKIMGAVRSSVAELPRARRLPKPDWGKVVLAAIALATLALGVDNYYLRQKLTSVKMTFDSNREVVETYVFELRGTPAAVNASGKVILDLHTGKALFGLHNLPTLPEGEAYYLWAFTQDKKILCGKFNTTSTGQIVSVLPIPVKEYSSAVKFMRISRESTTNSSDPKKKFLVMTSEL
ncbi:anti-sigma factor domain-containing protein [Pseudanabaena sp. PCC 6802]|uniref:anti-sigma factor domain-containing protein n=1 Tax=Pseudanabaena sp. PCC 6802 TaxID=118173 RepID=UPI000348D5B9|nr:anti-sigma factor [Pseudanabaena sp. PCC 6802]